MEFSIGGKQFFFGIYYASINCTVATVESSRSKKYFCRKEQKKKKKEENEVPGIIDPKCLACRSRPATATALLILTYLGLLLPTNYLPLMGYMLSCGRNKKTSST